MPSFTKRIYNVPTLRAAVADALEHVDDSRAAHRAGRVDKAFAERIMLAVTQVNGCRYCSYMHSRTALRAGVSADELQNLLQGGLDRAPREQLVALTFAQHLAESEGTPDPDAWQRVVDAYGADMARDIMAYIRMISMANLLGNTLDALLSRLRFQPAAGSSLWQELGVLASAPVIVADATIRRRLSRRAAVQDGFVPDCGAVGLTCAEESIVSKIKPSDTILTQERRR